MKVVEVKLYVPKGMMFKVAHIKTNTGDEYMTHYHIYDVEVGDEVIPAGTVNRLGYKTFYARKKR